MTVFTLTALFLIAFHLYRQHWTNKHLKQIHFGTFEAGAFNRERGDVFIIGDTVIAIQRAKGVAKKSVICFPGFTEDACYFQEAYKNCEHEVIYMGNAGYHAPFPVKAAQALNWPANPFDMGTIEHDAFWVGQAIETLASAEDVVIHGHSRGGAVAIDTGRQFPQLTKESVSLILEAAVVPKGTPAGPMATRVAHVVAPYFLPLFYGMNRNISLDKLAKLPIMRPSNPLKAKLIISSFSTPKQYKTFVKNVKNLILWQQNTSFDVYKNFSHVTALIGERDDVLSCRTMVASIKEGIKISSSMQMIQTQNTNHFITLEEPHYIYKALEDLPDKSGSVAS